MSIQILTPKHNGVLPMPAQLKRILFFEDDDLSRGTILDNLQPYVNNGLIISPQKAEEIPGILGELDYLNAILVTDYNLNKWVGTKHDKPITIDNKDLKDGLELLEHFQENDKKDDMFIYSANIDALERDFNNSPVMEVAQVITRDNKTKVGLTHVSKFLEEKVLEVITSNISVMPLHCHSISKRLQFFLTRKILAANPEDTIWKAGKHVWLVGFNKIEILKISEAELKILGDEYTSNQVQQYTIVRDYTELTITKFINGDRELRRDAICQHFKKGKDLHQLYNDMTIMEEYFILKVLCEEYLRKNINEERFMLALKQLNPVVRLESQKILFCKAQNLTRKKIEAKEDIYPLLKTFHDNGFDKVLDIFTGHVKKIDAENAYIHLQSRSSKNIERDEIFDAEFVRSKDLHENSKFEYTVYYSFDTESTATQIIPL